MWVSILRIKNEHENARTRTYSLVVVWVLDVGERLAVASWRPCPRAGVARTLDENELAGRTTRTNTVDGCLHL